MTAAQVQKPTVNISTETHETDRTPVVSKVPLTPAQIQKPTVNISTETVVTHPIPAIEEGSSDYTTGRETNSQHPFRDSCNSPLSCYRGSFL